MSRSKNYYNAKAADLDGEKTLSRTAYAARHVLWDLQTADMIGYGPNSLYWQNRNRERVIVRTNSRQHYRMPVEAASILAIEAIDCPGTQPTDPPTVLATVSETLTKLETYVEGIDLPRWQIADGIRQLMPYIATQQPMEG